MTYIIRKTDKRCEMESGFVECYPWGGEYRPRTEFRIGWDDGGFHVHLLCNECDPRVTAIGRNSEVWYDSCMEFFFSPSKDLSAGYFNCEMNAYPSMLLYYAISVKDEEREAVVYADEAFKLTCNKQADHWSLYVYIPFDMVRRYVPFEPKSGDIIRANVYKCGDGTKYPHFGCCFPIIAEENSVPNFHVPKFFGEMELE